MLAYEAFISGSEMEAYLWERIVIMSVEDIGMENRNAAALCTPIAG